MGHHPLVPGAHLDVAASARFSPPLCLSVCPSVRLLRNACPAAAITLRVWPGPRRVSSRRSHIHIDDAHILSISILYIRCHNDRSARDRPSASLTMAVHHIECLTWWVRFCLRQTISRLHSWLLTLIAFSFISMFRIKTTFMWLFCTNTWHEAVWRAYLCLTDISVIRLQFLYFIIFLIFDLCVSHCLPINFIVTYIFYFLKYLLKYVTIL